DDAAVEGHAAVPQLHDFDRVLEILTEIVKQDVADAAAEDDPERGVEDEVVGMAASEQRARLLEELQQIPIADEDARDIGEAVPAEVERPEMQRDARQPEVRESNELVIVRRSLQGLPPKWSAPHKARGSKGKE